MGINLVIGVLTGSLGPAAEVMVDRFGLSLTVINGGWPAAAILLPVCLSVNLLMIFLKLTKTLNVDIWNYWHFIAAGATGYILTGSYLFAILCAVVYEVIVLIIADKTQPMVEKFYGLPGITFPTASTASFAPLGILLGYLIEKIPGLQKNKSLS